MQKEISPHAALSKRTNTCGRIRDQECQLCNFDDSRNLAYAGAYMVGKEVTVHFHDGWI